VERGRHIIRAWSIFQRNMGTRNGPYISRQPFTGDLNISLSNGEWFAGEIQESVWWKGKGVQKRQDFGEDGKKKNGRIEWFEGSFMDGKWWIGKSLTNLNKSGLILKTPWVNGVKQEPKVRLLQ